MTKMKSSFRWLFLVIFILVILGMSALIYKNKDSWFTSKTTIKYPDNCIEQYKGTKLLTPECTEGRKILEDNKNGIPRSIIPTDYNISKATNQWNLNTNLNASNQ